MSYYVNSGSGSLRSLNAGDNDRATMNRLGAQVMVSYAQHLGLEGRMFRASNAARQTALAVGGTSFSDTAPAFNLDVPVGTTMIPNMIRLRQGGTVAGGVITVIIACDSTTRYSSAGTAHTPRNLRDDAPRASVVTVYSGPTIDAVATQWTEWASILDQDVGTIPSGVGTYVEWPNPGEVPPILIGPASMQIYGFAASTQPSWFFSFKWLELPTENVY